MHEGGRRREMGSEEENNSQCEVPSQRKGGTASERWIIVPHKNNNTSIRQSVAVARIYLCPFLPFLAQAERAQHTV